MIFRGRIIKSFLPKESDSDPMSVQRGKCKKGKKEKKNRKLLGTVGLDFKTYELLLNLQKQAVDLSLLQWPLGSGLFSA